jgi:hypothetical protein
MSVVALAEPSHTLAQAVDDLVVLTRNQAGGTCLWCGSRDLWVAAAGGGAPADGPCLVVTCRDCGAELVTEPLSTSRGRCA